MDAAALLAATAADQWGKMSPSIYETGRLAAGGWWLPGHRSRVTYLVDQQRADGSWSGPEAYALVPTLSATQGLLAALLEERTRLPVALRERVTAAVDRGLASGVRLLGRLRGAVLPDTPAIEVIVPYLVGLLQTQLDSLPTTNVSGLDRWRAGVRLTLPRGLDGVILAGVVAVLAAGQPAPLKVMHSLEVAGTGGHRGVPRPGACRSP
jgi:hypothetical protein